METYRLGKCDVDGIELKCLIAAKGVHVDDEIYERFSDVYRISRDHDRLSCIILPNGYVTPLADMGPTLRQYSKKYFLSDEEALAFSPQLQTPFRISITDGAPVLLFNGAPVCFVSFPAVDDFYDQTTRSGMPFYGNALLQGDREWITFGYEWPCDFARSGFPCQYCHCGNETAAQARCGKPFKEPIDARDMCDIIRYAVDAGLGRYLQITGGSTFDGKLESKLFIRYLEGVNEYLGRDYLPGDIVLYLTPPEDFSLIDRYLSLGADKLGMSVEVWDKELARIITPGKMRYTSRERHLAALEYTVEKFGPGHAFCQFVVGCEPFESMKEGAIWLAERGITPVCSILQQTSLAINEHVVTPDLDYYRRVKELFLYIYDRYDIVPAEAVGENGCIEVEFYNEVHSCG